ncbi:MAG: sugar ABC transporter permease [Deinococcus sp.]|nr:sugar ABC transporter permease [Deinococcus sp.]
MKPFLSLVTILNVIYVFNSFPIIWILTKGGPANLTHVLVTHMYNVAFINKRFGQASAIGVVMFVVLFLFSVAYTALTAREMLDEGEHA